MESKPRCEATYADNMTFDIYPQLITKLWILPIYNITIVTYMYICGIYYHYKKYLL